MSKSEQNKDNRVIVKKYSNRRLYDTTNKKYVTLEEISSLIRNGYEVRVIDSQSGADISKVVLIQVILESEKNREDILPVSFLHMLIKYGNKIAKDFFENYFLMMFQPYLSVQKNMQENLQIWKELGWTPPGFPNNEEIDGNDQEERFDKDITRDLEKGDKKKIDTDNVKILEDRLKQLEKKLKSLEIEEKTD
ncbi:MAG: polyhydroxyalkanoate synthesis regulator DNA-binding domain-containing protein [Thermodesulfobacteriota bacterium]